MSQWHRLSRKHRILSLLAVTLLVATAAWAARGALDEEATINFATQQKLAAPLPPPTEVFIQKTTAFASRGNVLVSVQLSPDQLAAKQADGTAAFLTIGNPDSEVLLRDDGQGGDAVAGDGLFTGIGTVDDAELSARKQSDDGELAGRSDDNAPVFAGRNLVGNAKAVPFDLTGYQAGQRVRLDPAIAFADTARASATFDTPVASSRGMLESAAAPALVLGTNLFQDRVLMIRDPLVVKDATRTLNPCNNAGTANGVWTFEHLIREMANQTASGIDPRDFAETWIQHWADTNLTINGDFVDARPRINNIINQWRNAGTSGKLELHLAPLRLLAIVPRVDLRTTSGGGGGYVTNSSGNFLDAGEARFVFGFVLKPTWSAANLLGAVQIPGEAAGCRALPFSVIFEYRVPKCDCKGVKGWAQQWVNLRNFAPGSADYNGRLELLTEQFARVNANPTKPNGSALGQLRSNEIATDPPGGFFSWELREFQLTQFPFTFLNETTTADTPQDQFQATVVFRDWILNHVAPALTLPVSTFPSDPIPPVQLLFQTPPSPFMSAHPQVNPNATFFWNAPGLNLSPNGGNNTDNWGRHRAGLAACNGCHAQETDTEFVHVDPSDSLGSIQSPVRISGFLSGITVADPAEAAGLPVRTFDDLERRELDIKKVARMSCFRFHAINAFHVKATLKATGALPADLFSGLPSAPVEMRVPVGVDDMRRNLIGEVH